MKLLIQHKKKKYDKRTYQLNNSFDEVKIYQELYGENYTYTVTVRSKANKLK